MAQGLESEKSLGALETRQRKPLTFGQVRPFISLEGLDSKTANSFLNFLHELFEKTPKRLWSRESCCGAIEIARTARTISSDYFPEQTEINIGEAAFKLKQDGMLDVIFIRRTGSEKSVRTEPAGNYELPPWEGLI
ncbi:MAG: hypothetical protein V1858_05145 [Candidatus Gottesmanbacteria bacterium]